MSWDGGGDGVNWTSAQNWSNDGVPTQSDDVTINVANPNLQIYVSATQSCRSFVVANNMLFAGSINVFGNMTMLQNAKITLGDVNNGNSGGSVRFTGQPTFSLDGTGTLEIANGSGGVFLDNFNAAPRTLTIGAGITIRMVGGQNGFVTTPDITFSPTIINHGTIEAAAPTGKMYVCATPSTSIAAHFTNDGPLIVRNGGSMTIAGTWDSTGPIVIDNGNFQLAGRFPPTVVNNVQRNGPGQTLIDEGSTPINGGLLKLSDVTGSVMVGENGGVDGPGTIQTSGNAQLLFRGARLTNVAIDGTVVLTAFTTQGGGTITGNGRLISTGGTLQGGLTAQNGARLSNATIQGSLLIPDDNAMVFADTKLTVTTARLQGNNTALVAVGAQTWGGTFSFESASTPGRVLIMNSAPETPVTLTLTGTINGGLGQIADHPDNVAPATLLNQGTISATRTGTEIVVQNGVFTNNGTLLATNAGTLRVVTMPTNYALATQTLTGGSWNVTGNSTLILPDALAVTINNANITLTDPSATLAAIAGMVENAGTITLANQANFNCISPFTNRGIIAINTGSVAHFVGGIAGGGTLTVDTASGLATTFVRQSALTIKGTVSLATDSDVSSVQTLSITTSTGKLDLNNNDLIIDYTGTSQMSSIRSLISTGRAGGAWTGNGITSGSAKVANPSNTTLGLLEASDFKSIYGTGATFDSQPVDNTAVLVKYTYYGDTDFNGRVDGADYTRIDTTFNQQVATGSNIGGWLNGDLDYNGKVDGGDYALIDGAFNTQGSSLRRQPRTGSGLKGVSHVD